MHGGAGARAPARRVHAEEHRGPAGPADRRRRERRAWHRSPAAVSQSDRDGSFRAGRRDVRDQHDPIRRRVLRRDRRDQRQGHDRQVEGGERLHRLRDSGALRHGASGGVPGREGPGLRTAHDRAQEQRRRERRVLRRELQSLTQWQRRLRERAQCRGRDPARHAVARRHKRDRVEHHPVPERRQRLPLQLRPARLRWQRQVRQVLQLLLRRRHAPARRRPRRTRQESHARALHHLPRRSRRSADAPGRKRQPPIPARGEQPFPETR